ncbi:phosphatase 2C-like domain-containing protein [Cercophora newfieldiana]|uniref:Phosphatase 2C-like domain-containing protein n=1 Tax=Cercophora newfieldiana TaxID=92897 RepID=A0AA40CMG9_9PEZI|nr:phosphatase 2C-like domain-containing protein [Cercophora newfieldiana]
MFDVPRLLRGQNAPGRGGSGPSVWNAKTTAPRGAHEVQQMIQTGRRDVPKKIVTSPPSLADDKDGFPFGFQISPPSPTEVTEILNRDTWSVSKPSNDVSRYDGAQLPHSATCEDRYIHGTFPSPAPGSSEDWMAFGVYDGHLGPRTSEALVKHLLPYVSHALGEAAQSGPLSDESVTQHAIKSAFCSLDDALVKDAQKIMDSDLPWAEKVVRLGTASNGSCALLSLYDPSSRKLHVACTGDSRAVMGRQRPDGTWETVALSVDQGGSNPDEKERVKSEHPGENVDELVKDGRILGLATMRAFGDFHWKAPLETIQQAGDGYNAVTIRMPKPEVYKTPPYLTAKPEVTTTVIEKGRPAFMIMASDGMWDTISSEEAVGLVGKWLEWRAKGSPAPKEPSADKFGHFDYAEHRKNKGRIPEANFVTRDENAAVHLIRNGLGGAHHDMVSGTLSFRPPYARWVRDDVTVQVVFFNC